MRQIEYSAVIHTINIIQALSACARKSCHHKGNNAKTLTAKHIKKYPLEYQDNIKWFLMRWPPLDEEVGHSKENWNEDDANENVLRRNPPGSIKLRQYIEPQIIERDPLRRSKLCLDHVNHIGKHRMNKIPQECEGNEEDLFSKDGKLNPCLCKHLIARAYISQISTHRLYIFLIRPLPGTFSIAANTTFTGVADKIVLIITDSNQKWANQGRLISPVLRKIRQAKLAIRRAFMCNRGVQHLSFFIRLKIAPLAISPTFLRTSSKHTAHQIIISNVGCNPFQI
mmetsp:Transcript_16960/g.26466  ORF Transcript_16960/g.26466 Transcript_16960/m.26466 type:complete len:283 (+) Transcript_16960:580-1428(+)